ncbi:MAG: hemerythrin domain-containing protein [Candidatus Anammoxibacter sp.]
MGKVDKATTILSNEHKNISKVIDAVISECNSLESGKETDKVFFEKTVEFIQNYADKFHHAKEENILFVELHKDGVEMHCDPIPQMLHEHDLGRDFVKGIIVGLNENNKEKMVENAKGYTSLIKEHIFKEDNILYPMADEALNEQSQESVLAKFIEEEKLFAEGHKEICFSIVKEFENRPA